jgi:hypothetical protein
MMELVISGFYLQGGTGGSFSPKAPSFPPKRKEKKEKKREREREGEGGRERRTEYLGDMIIHDIVNNIRRIYYLISENHKMY